MKLEAKAKFHAYTTAFHKTLLTELKEVDKLHRNKNGWEKASLGIFQGLFHRNIRVEFQTQT